MFSEHSYGRISLCAQPVNQVSGVIFQNPKGRPEVNPNVEVVAMR